METGLTNEPKVRLSSANTFRVTIQWAFLWRFLSDKQIHWDRMLCLSVFGIGFYVVLHMLQQNAGIHGSEFSVYQYIHHRSEFVDYNGHIYFERVRLDVL